jgi:hypothetical protein
MRCPRSDHGEGPQEPLATLPRAHRSPAWSPRGANSRDGLSTWDSPEGGPAVSLGLLGGALRAFRANLNQAQGQRGALAQQRPSLCPLRVFTCSRGGNGSGVWLCAHAALATMLGAMTAVPTVLARMALPLFERSAAGSVDEVAAGHHDPKEGQKHKRSHQHPPHAHGSSPLEGLLGFERRAAYCQSSSLLESRSGKAAGLGQTERLLRFLGVHRRPQLPELFNG